MTLTGEAGMYIFEIVTYIVEANKNEDAIARACAGVCMCMRVLDRTL